MFRVIGKQICKEASQVMDDAWYILCHCITASKIQVTTFASLACPSLQGS